MKNVEIFKSGFVDGVYHDWLEYNNPDSHFCSPHTMLF